MNWNIIFEEHSKILILQGDACQRWKKPEKEKLRIEFYHFIDWFYFRGNLTSSELWIFSQTISEVEKETPKVLMSWWVKRKLGQIEESSIIYSTLTEEKRCKLLWSSVLAVSGSHIIVVRLSHHCWHPIVQIFFDQSLWLDHVCSCRRLNKILLNVHDKSHDIIWGECFEQVFTSYKTIPKTKRIPFGWKKFGAKNAKAPKCNKKFQLNTVVQKWRLVGYRHSWRIILSLNTQKLIRNKNFDPFRRIRRKNVA